MSNEAFFLEVCRRGYLQLVSEEPEIKNGMKIYCFNFCGVHSSDDKDDATGNKIMFNQIGGYIGMEEL